MRTLLRLMLFWAVIGPLFYFFGLPIGLEHITKKTRADAFNQCVEHLRNEKLLGAQGIPPARGDSYCHCISDGLTVTKADLFEIAQKKTPAALTALSQATSQRCNDDLTREMNAAAAQAYEAAQQPALVAPAQQPAAPTQPY